jgi:hypothetical protein
MSVIFSGTFSGTFTSNAQNKFISLPSGVDWMQVNNESVLIAGGIGSGAQFSWRKGMVPGDGIIYVKEGTIGALVPGPMAVNTGFFLQNTTVNPPGPSRAITGITGGNPPVVNIASTLGLINGTIVRIFSTVGAQQVGAMDFTINTITPNTSFELAYMAAIANANPGAGTMRVIPFNPYFYPSNRYITKVSQATQAIVTLSVDHTYVVGQVVRFTVPTVTATRYGMTELNGLSGTIVAVNQADADGITNTITVDIDTSGFSAFAFPITTDPKFTPAFVKPYGENMAVGVATGSNYLADAVTNTGQFGMLLMAGALSPAGVDGDVISWIAGKSFNQ